MKNVILGKAMWAKVYDPDTKFDPNGYYSVSVLVPEEEAQEMLKGTMPIGRMGTAEEVAGAIYFFASPDSSLCQGSVLSVDGGFTAQ